MALTPRDSIHALQIQAGTLGRNTGHSFEASLSDLINNLSYPRNASRIDANIISGSPELDIINKALTYLKWPSCDRVEALALGRLATADAGKQWLEVHGVVVKACKSDILLTLYHGNKIETIGVSVKQCNNYQPTNAQLYFTTARAFCTLLLNNGIEISEYGINSLRQFCGDEGFRPMDDPQILNSRKTDPRRYYWEEINKNGKEELERIFSKHQNQITKLLLQKAYLNDPFIPQLLVHKTKKILTGPQEYALYTIDELVERSIIYSGFYKKSYSVRKGQYRDPEGAEHEAPRFGIVQMQRGGQKQHPTQLQFNLKAGYFYCI